MSPDKAPLSFSAVTEKVERLVVPAALWFAAVAYSVLKFVDHDLKLADWEPPLVLVTLAIVLRIVDQARSQLDDECRSSAANHKALVKEIEEVRVEYALKESERAAAVVVHLETILGSVARQDRSLGRMANLIGTTCKVEVYDTAREFFDGLNRALRQSSSRVWVTYVRDGPPRQQVEEGQDYFEACERWAQLGGHSFRRIIYCHSTNSELREWVADEYAKTLDVARHFAIRVWPDRATDRMSIALFDDREVVCSFVADRDDIQAFSIQNTAIVQHFRGFFQRLWDASTPPQNFLASEVNHTYSAKFLDPKLHDGEGGRGTHAM